ncbi:MAG: class I SAM-dependent methyltransferase [Acidimicrobiia bacterium]
MQQLTGERPIEGKTPAGILALHDAGYRAVADAARPGRFLDVGCGLGDYAATFASPKCAVFGIDYDSLTAYQAHAIHPELSTVCSDGAVLPWRDATFDTVCSSHLIEHFTDPEPHVAELARVCADDGVVCIVTPNAPADFENPYHLYLFDPADLQRMLERHFADVTVTGLDGDDELKAEFEQRRRFGRAVLKADVLNLRHRLPRRAYVEMHALARRVAYPLVRLKQRFDRTQGVAAPSAVTADNFHLTEAIDESTLVLFAVARKPLRP